VTRLDGTTTRKPSSGPTAEVLSVIDRASKVEPLTSTTRARLHYVVGKWLSAGCSADSLVDAIASSPVHSPSAVEWTLLELRPDLAVAPKKRLVSSKNDQEAGTTGRDRDHLPAASRQPIELGRQVLGLCLRQVRRQPWRVLVGPQQRTMGPHEVDPIEWPIAHVAILPPGAGGLAFAAGARRHTSSRRGGDAGAGARRRHRRVPAPDVDLVILLATVALCGVLATILFLRFLRAVQMLP